MAWSQTDRVPWPCRGPCLYMWDNRTESIFRIFQNASNHTRVCLLLHIAPLLSPQTQTGPSTPMPRRRHEQFTLHNSVEAIVKWFSKRPHYLQAGIPGPTHLAVTCMTRIRGHPPQTSSLRLPRILHSSSIGNEETDQKARPPDPGRRRCTSLPSRASW